MKRDPCNMPFTNSRDVNRHRLGFPNLELWPLDGEIMIIESDYLCMCRSHCPKTGYSLMSGAVGLFAVFIGTN